MTITIFIRDTTRQPFSTKSLEIDEKINVSDLKTLIFDKTGIPKSIQNLAFNARFIIDDTMTLLSLGLNNLSEIILDAKFLVLPIDPKTEQPIPVNFSDPIKMSRNTFNKFCTNIPVKYSFSRISSNPSIYSVQDRINDSSFKVIIENDDLAEDSLIESSSKSNDVLPPLIVIDDDVMESVD